MTDPATRLLRLQSEGIQLFTAALRRWFKATMDGQCVCHTIGAIFREADLAAVTAPFHASMRLLCQNPRVPLRFGKAGHPSLSEHEAKLAQALVAGGEARFQDLRSIAAELVYPDFAPAFAKALGAVAQAFERTMPLAPPEP